MLRIYKLPDGRTYRFEEGDQPADAILVEVTPVEVMTPETTPTKKPRTTRKRTAAPKE